MFGYHGPGLGPTPTPAPPAPELTPCDDAEATSVLLDCQSGRFWSESIQKRLERMRAAGYVIAKTKKEGA